MENLPAFTNHCCINEHVNIFRKDGNLTDICKTLWPQPIEFYKWVPVVRILNGGSFIGHPGFPINAGIQRIILCFSDLDPRFLMKKFNQASRRAATCEKLSNDVHVSGFISQQVK